MPPPVCTNAQQPVRQNTTDTQPGPPDPSANEGDEFTLVSRNGRNRKGKGKAPAMGQATTQTTQPSNSYAGAASAAAATRQPPPPPPLPKQGNPLPSITEVTVLQSGGHPNPLTESQTRARAADAIIREVRIKMAKVLKKPITLRAGRWSIHPRSKGNFVYSFNSHIPFDVITSYEHILLDLFHGVGQLRPSLGWTRLLAHGVPLLDNDDRVFDSDALLKEVKTMPGLKKVQFAMPPRWLRPTDSISSHYSTITFAISDPDCYAQVLSVAYSDFVSAFYGQGRHALAKRGLLCQSCHVMDVVAGPPPAIRGRRGSRRV